MVAPPLFEQNAEVGADAWWERRGEEEPSEPLLLESSGDFTPVWAVTSGPAYDVLLAGGLLASGACSGEPASEEPTTAGQADQALALEEILRDLTATEEKVLALAEAISAEQYGWRPGEGVRSSGEVFMHIASVNYAFPMFVGVEAPDAAAMSLDDLFPSIAAYEGTADTKDEIVPALQASFRHLRAAVQASSTDLDRGLEVVGMPTSVRGFWWVHLGHVHEHLGQLIAYARSNGIAPPWS